MFHIRALCLVVVVLLVAASSRLAWAEGAIQVVSLDSLLREMIDRNAVARLPTAEFVCKQASSCDRRKNDPFDAATWHSNDDHDQFLHTEMNQGRKEWVVMEADGAGAITRIWTPLDARLDRQIVRFYFDGASQPAIAVPFNDLLSGRSFVKPPLAFIAWPDANPRVPLKTAAQPLRGVGGDCYLPIPFARHCKVTLDSQPFYYHFNYRIYETGTKVATFSMADFQTLEKSLLREVVRKLDDIGGLFTTNGSNPKTSDELPGWNRETAVVAPGGELSIALPKPVADGAAVTSLAVWIDARQAGAVLRSTVIAATFDDEETVWCPLSEFFAAGARSGIASDWWRTAYVDDAAKTTTMVRADGRTRPLTLKPEHEGFLACRWVMPYQRSGRITLKNLGQSPRKLTLYIDYQPWKWDDRALHFHAKWRSQHNLKTRPISDWNYVKIQGQGRYVGDTLTVFSPVQPWYGEGDERIYYDGATFPAHIGTGTEDYYGYAWGMASQFSSPFLSMPRRDRESRDDWRGYTTTSRLRLLDDIPFQSSLRNDMEVWNWADTQVDYAVATFWYARPGCKDNRPPQPAEAATAVRDNPEDFHVAGAIECETLPITAKSAGLRTEIQVGGGLSEGQWSRDTQLFVLGQKAGDFVELQIPARGAQAVNLLLYTTKSWDYGILRFSVNGQKAGPDYDAYREKPAAAGPIDLGQFTPSAGKFTLRVEVVGGNPASKGTHCYFGLDCVVLKQLK